MLKSFFCFEDAQEAQKVISSKFSSEAYFNTINESDFQFSFELAAIQALYLWRIHSETGYRTRYFAADCGRFELHYAEQGTFSIRIRDAEYKLRPGMACLLSTPGEVEITASAGVRKTVIAIPRNRYAAIATGLGLDPQNALQGYKNLVAVADEGIEAVFDIAGVIVGQHGEDSGLVAAPQGAYLLKEALITIFVQRWPRRSDDQPVLEGTESVALKRAVFWIQEHLGEDFTVTELAREAGMSVRSLQSAFKRHYNDTPFGYIQKLRLQQIHHDLLFGEEKTSISEIAARAGFAHMSYFAAKYRALYGETPSETRNKRRNPKPNPNRMQ